MGVHHYSLGSLWYGFRQYGKFSSKEFKHFIITVLIIGFIIGFNDKRPTSSMDSYYIFFMIFSIFAAAFALFFKLFIQRYFLYKFGYAPTYAYSINSLLIGIVLIFATEGKLWFLVPGFTVPTLLQAERLGKWRHGFRILDHARGLAFGIWALVFFTIFLKIFQTPDSILLNHIITINLAIAFYSSLPLPECDGLYILYGGYRWMWVLTMSFVIAAWIMIKLLSSVWIILFGSVIIAGIAAWAFVWQDQTKVYPKGE